MVALLLAVVSMGGLFGMRAVGSPDRVDEAVQAEDRMYQSKTQSGEVAPNEHKRSGQESAEEDLARAGNL